MDYILRYESGLLRGILKTQGNTPDSMHSLNKSVRGINMSFIERSIFKHYPIGFNTSSSLKISSDTLFFRLSQSQKISGICFLKKKKYLPYFSINIIIFF